MQARLLELGYTELVVADGDFGALTEQAVRRFQQDRGLVVDGVVGPQTWGVLFSLAAPAGRPTASAPAAFSRVLDFIYPPIGGADVEAVLHRLRALGDLQNCRGQNYAPQRIVYDARVFDAVRAFQARHSLPNTGKVDRTTWDRLFSPDAVSAPARVFAPPALGPAPPPASRGWLAFTLWSIVPGTTDGFRSVRRMDQAGGNGVNLTADSRSDNFAPAWSPDGARLAFVSNRDGQPEVFVMNFDGTDVVQVTCGARIALVEAAVAWSPDSAWLAYSALDGVYAAALDGSGRLRQISDHPTAETLAWSPDGARLAVTGGGVVEIASADSSGSRPIAMPGYYGADWSPDGVRLVLSDLFNLFLINADGTGLMRLTNWNDGASAQYPAWSPDGSRLAFQTNRNLDGRFRISLINPDGSNQVDLPGSSSADYIEVDWQP